MDENVWRQIDEIICFCQYSTVHLQIKYNGMKSVVEIFQFVRSRLNKYWIAVIVGLTLTFLVGEYSIFNRISYDRQINQLKSKIEYYVQQNKDNEQKIKELQSDSESLERLAREQYQMVKPDEELFIIKE